MGPGEFASIANSGVITQYVIEGGFACISAGAVALVGFWIRRGMKSSDALNQQQHQNIMTKIDDIEKRLCDQIEVNHEAIEEHKEVDKREHDDLWKHHFNHSHHFKCSQGCDIKNGQVITMPGKM